MISINQLKGGMALLIEGELHVVLTYEHVKPGKGSAFVRTRVRSVKSGKILDRTFRTSDKLEDVFIDTKKLQYLYKSGEDYYFMDLENYDHIHIHESIVAEAGKFLKENMEVAASFYEGRAISFTGPVFVELKVVSGDPGLRGDTVKGGSKTVKLETGMEVQVPLFINIGDVLKIDTRTGEYVERAQTKN